MMAKMADRIAVTRFILHRSSTAEANHTLTRIAENASADFNHFVPTRPLVLADHRVVR